MNLTFHYYHLFLTNHLNLMFLMNHLFRLNR